MLWSIVEQARRFYSQNMNWQKTFSIYDEIIDDFAIVKATAKKRLKNTNYHKYKGVNINILNDISKVQ